jgi:hypothetical protein
MTVWPMRIACWIPRATKTHSEYIDCVWIVMAHAQKTDFVFRRNGRVLLNRRRRQFSRLLAAEVCASAVVMLDTPCSEVVWRVLATHSIRHFPLHFLSLHVRHRVSSHFNWTLILTAFPPTTVVARTRRNITLHLHCLSCWQEGRYCVAIPYYGISPSDLVHNTVSVCVVPERRSFMA